MKQFFLLFLISIICFNCKHDDSQLKFEKCKDSLINLNLKTIVKSKDKIILDYRFGLSKLEFRKTSYRLTKENKLDKNSKYTFDYNNLKNVKFLFLPKYHNDSLVSLDLYDSDLTNFELSFNSLNTILKDKYKNPICSCKTNKVWVSDRKLIQTSISEKDKSLSLIFMDLGYENYYRKNKKKIEFNFDNEYNMNTYDKWYMEKVIIPEKKLRQKIENNRNKIKTKVEIEKASKDL